MAGKKPPETQRAGYVAIIGAPNAGKSTLLNRLVGHKVSITSPKPQTTRMKVSGIWSDDESQTQIVFMDTPGLFEPKRRLDRAMVQAAWATLDDANVVLLVIDAGKRKNEATDKIIVELKRRQQHVVAVLNKIDTIKRDQLLPLAAALQETGLVDDTVMISAKSGDGLDDVKKLLADRMPENPWYFDGEELSDLPTQVWAAEITREQLYRQLQQELPYAATVAPESLQTKKDGSVVIRQNIIVARKAHKPIVLGAGGARIKSIGEAARKDMIKIFDTPVHLFLDVKCDENWQERADYYHLFGLDFDKGKGASKKKKSR
jgi:GTP-binding protein Era